jgi:hypothetical protein
MLTQTAIRSDAFHRSVPPTRNVALAATKVFDGASERKPLGQSIYLMGAAKSYPRNAEIYGENELAERTASDRSVAWVLIVASVTLGRP